MAKEPMDTIFNLYPSLKLTPIKNNMTHKDYLFSDALNGEANVISCASNNNRWEVVLDRTLFHPRGGGQLPDLGWINDSLVIDVILKESTIVHIVDTPISNGSVKIKVDLEKRILHSRLHSAGHLIGHAGMLIGLTPIKAQHWPESSSVSFNHDQEIEHNQEYFEKTVNDLVNKNLAREYESHDGERIVHFESIARFACGGTHVPNLKEIKTVKILGIKNKKNILVISYTVTP